MKEASIHQDAPIVADDQSSEVREPRNQALDHLASSIASQLAPVVEAPLLGSQAVRDDRFGALSLEQATHEVRVVAAIGD